MQHGHIACQDWLMIRLHAQAHTHTIVARCLQKMHCIASCKTSDCPFSDALALFPALAGSVMIVLSVVLLR